MTVDITQNLLSRFQIHEGCPNLPGHCAVCGSSTGLMFDFGIELDFYGHIYICVRNCAQEMANRLGYFSANQVDRIKVQHSELVKAQEQLIAENKDLHNAVDAFSRIRVNAFDSNVDQLLLDLNNEEDNPEIDGSTREELDSSSGDGEPDEAESSSTDKESESGETGPDESDDGNGFAKLSGDDSLEILSDGSDI